MAQALYQAPNQNNLQYTLSLQLAQGGNTAVLNTSVAGIVQAPGVFVVDRINTSGSLTPTVREYISFTGVSGANLTGLTKGLGGSSDQVHAVSAIVEFVPDVVQENAWYTVFTNGHDVYGSHISLPSVAYATISNATITNAAVTSVLTASGASLQGFPIRPTWVLPGILSGASTSAGFPLTMTDPGNFQYLMATAQGPASNSSVYFDVLKNFTSILAGSKIFAIPQNGTFVSLGSIATTSFNRGDVFTINIGNPSSYVQNVTITGFAR